MIAADFTPSEKSYFVVMPSSLWQSKCWPAGIHAERIRKFAGTRTAWVVGSSKDHASRELVDRLQRAGCPVRDGVGRHTLPELARVLRGAEFYFGSDTGIAHLAEAGAHARWCCLGRRRRTWALGRGVRRAARLGARTSGAGRAAKTGGCVSGSTSRTRVCVGSGLRVWVRFCKRGGLLRPFPLQRQLQRRKVTFSARRSRGRRTLCSSRRLGRRLVRG